MDGGGWRTNTDRPPHGQIRTTDHEKFENVDGGGQMDENPSIDAWFGPLPTLSRDGL